MEINDIKTLSNYRLEHAEECLNAAKLTLKANDYRSAANRSYYAVFHAMRAVLAYDGIDMKHHSGIISEFRRLYIKTGVLPVWMSNVIGIAFDIRTEADYDDFYLVDNESIKTQVDDAEKFINEIKLYLNKK